MTMVSLGDLAQSFIMRRQSADAKAQLQILSTELTTGVALDKAAHLSGNLSSLAGIESSLSKLRGYHNVTTNLSLTAGAMQIALQAIGDQSSDFAGSLLSASSSASQARIDTVAEDAVLRFDTVVQTLNTRFGDRSLFAGTATNQPALIGSDQLLDLMYAATSGATGAPDAEALLDAWFADPAGFVAQAYLGGDAQQPIGIASGENAKLDVTALDPAIMETLKALALPALMTRGLLAGQTVGQNDIARRSGERLLEAQNSWATLQGRLGTTEAQLSAASSRNAAESSALDIARAGLIGIDSFDTATQLEATQTQLETLYALTARMQRLNLADYL
jgi:flagellar hook-associated protein 3 FlgL